MESWIQTYTGKKFDLKNPTPDMVDIEDIAHALSMQCRFAGHCRYLYTIAEHSVHVSYAVPQEVALQGLMHDAAEAYLTDLPTPLKDMLPAYKKLETVIMQAILDAYCIQFTKEDHALVKFADAQVLRSEAEEIVTQPFVENWPSTLPKGQDIYIGPWTPGMAKAIFLDRFNALINIPKTKAA